MAEAPIDHLLLHLHDALASDGRVGELGLEVTLDEADPDVIVVRGSVSTIERKQAIMLVSEEVLRSFGAQRRVDDRTAVTITAVPTGEGEQL